jgi:shikimate kinase
MTSAASPIPPHKIYLVGFMGAGKTTVGRALAHRLGWRFEDIDAEVERREGRAIADISRLLGEGRFRAVEREALQALLGLADTVVATGGGTFMDPANRAAMLADGVVAWLDIPFSRVLERVPPDGRRPLASSRAELESLYHARRAAYQLAHLRLDASTASSGELVEVLIHRLGW